MPRHPRVPASVLLPAALTLLAACGSEAGDPESSPPLALAPPATGPELVARSIQYHDPEGAWAGFSHTLVIRQERPNGDARRASVRLDVPTGGFGYEEDTSDGTVVKGVTDDGCFASIDGQEPTAELEVAHRLDCPNVERMRNYYLYLWGLPMKLNDPGTHVAEEIGRGEFDERATLSAKVTYDAEVGGDTWYFYFDAGDYRLVGYRFYHDEAAGDGEYILLRDTREVLGMQLPRVRRWFTNQDSTFLGTDSLVEDFPGQPLEAYQNIQS